jgi:tetratricopeptide (TPR) repeat protein
MILHALRRRQEALLLALALVSVAPQALAEPPAGAPPNDTLSPEPPANASSKDAPSPEPPANAPSKDAPSPEPPASAPSNDALPLVPAAAAARAPSADARPGPAAADEPDSGLPRAVELRRRGKRAWDERRYADALSDYEESVALSPDPRLYYNLADICEKVGRYADALRWLTRFQFEASRGELERVPHLSSRLALLRNRVALLKVNVNVPGARVLVRDAVVGIQPAGQPLAVSLNAGPALVEIIGDGYRPYYKEHSLPGGGSLELVIALNREAAPVTVVERNTTVYVHSPAFWSQWWFWAGASVLLAGGAATVYALSTEKAPSKRPDDPTIVTSLPSEAILRF